MIRLRFTQLWFLFGPVLGCMWMAAVNYTNNLVYAVLYLIMALSFVSIFHTWRNLASVEIVHVRVKPAFAGAEIEVEIHLRNHGGRSSNNLIFQRLDPHGITPLRTAKGARVLPGDATNITWSFLPAQRRGRYKFERLLVQSAYPFGLFWAQVRVPVDAVHFVYPTPRGHAELPQLQASGSQGLPDRTGDDFSGVRAYSPGESLRHVDWKAYARGRPLVVKQFTGGEGRELWLEGQLLRRMPFEDRLSQLAHVGARGRGGRGALRLQFRRRAPAAGAGHEPPAARARGAGRRGKRLNLKGAAASRCRAGAAAGR